VARIWSWQTAPGSGFDAALIRLGMALAALALVPNAACAQTAPPRAPAPPAPVDPALQALTPDSALADPMQWALDSEAAHAPPDPESLAAIATLGKDSTTPVTDNALAAIPGLTIAWPDSFALPPIPLLTPDADIAAAASVTRAAGDALDVALPRGGWRGPLGADAVVKHVAPGIDLVFAKDELIPELDDVADRFVALSSLHTLGRGEDNLAQLSRRAHDDGDLLVQILRLYGYYDAEVSQNLIGLAPTASAPAPATKGRPAAAAQATARFEVVPGSRYALGRIDLRPDTASPPAPASAIVGLDTISQSADRVALLGALALKPGDPAQTEAIQAGRDRLIDQLGHGGFAFAKVGDPALAVDHATHLADLALPVIPGGKYRFGTVHSSLPRYLNAHHLQRMARFRSGTLYDQRLVEDFRRVVLSTGIIGSVAVTPHEVAPPTDAAPGVADIDVKLTKGPEHTIAAQIGLSNGEGFEIDGSWEDRNLFPPEGMLRLHGILGTRQQLAGATLRRSNFLARDQAINLSVYAQSLDTNAYRARTLSAILTLDKQSTLLFQKKWAWSLGAQVIATKQQKVGAPAGTPFVPYFIGALPMKLAYDGSNNLLDPTRGLRIAVTVSPAISIQDGPRSSYVTTQLDASSYQPITSRVVLAERVRVAAINGTAIANIAPSQRLYAGGGASVRGYGYQAVGPRDATNTPIGGLSLTEFSLEARVRTGFADGALSVVPFIDAGSIGETPTPVTRGAKIGAGLGLRYKTNFGPIRFDIGTPLNRSPGDSRIGVYISLGQAF
jgi:translocation and assembly module TamA